MINRKDITQRTIEWHELKHGKIGGVLSKGLFIKSDTLLIDILSQRMEEFEPAEDGFMSDAMERGHEFEPFARQYLNDYTGLDFLETGWLQCEENELLGISPDGITDCEEYQCEIKCFGRKKHYEVLLNNAIPLENIAQIVHGFTVNPKLKALYFIAFRPEAPSHFIRKIDRDTIVNLGTKAKPVELTVQGWVYKALNAADELLADIKVKEQLLSNL